jgi:hypothetical protein
MRKNNNLLIYCATYPARIYYPPASAHTREPAQWVNRLVSPVFPRWLGRFGMAFAPFPRKPGDSHDILLKRPRNGWRHRFFGGNLCNGSYGG